MPPPLSVAVRPAVAADATAIRRVHVAAFGRAAEAELVERLRARVSLVSLVACCADDAVVGHALCSPVIIAGEAVPSDALGLGPLAVDPAHQRRGVGSVLVRESLRVAVAGGHALVFVLGDPAYYGRFGFVAAAASGLRCEFDAPPGAFMVAELVPGALARRAGTVRYDPEFQRVEPTALGWSAASTP